MVICQFHPSSIWMMIHPHSIGLNATMFKRLDTRRKKKKPENTNLTGALKLSNCFENAIEKTL